MEFRHVPALVLIAIGVILVAVFVVDPPSASQGGPAGVYVLLLGSVFIGGGSLAVVTGVYSLKTNRFRLSAVLLPGYGAVGVIYVVIKLRLFLELSDGQFATSALGFVALVLYGTFKRTNTDYWDASADDSSRA